MSINPQFVDNFELLFGCKVPSLHHFYSRLKICFDIERNNCMMFWTPLGRVLLPGFESYRQKHTFEYDEWSLLSRWMARVASKHFSPLYLVPENEDKLGPHLREIAKHEIHLAAILRLFIIKD